MIQILYSHTDIQQNDTKFPEFVSNQYRYMVRFSNQTDTDTKAHIKLILIKSLDFKPLPIPIPRQSNSWPGELNTIEEEKSYLNVIIKDRLFLNLCGNYFA
jgi:hypothetical protein